MKKLNYFLLSLLTLFVLSCNRDDNNISQTTVTKEQIIGTWEPTEIKIKGSVSVYGYNLDLEENIPITACERQSRAVFGTDGKGSSLLYVQIPAQYARFLGSGCEKFLDVEHTYTYDEATKTVTTTDTNGNIEKIRVISTTNTEIVIEQEMKGRSIKGFPFTGVVTAKFKKLP